ncbi:MAG: hypothetical protein WDZ49_05630 [Litorilinea sp.]
MKTKLYQAIFPLCMLALVACGAPSPATAPTAVTPPTVPAVIQATTAPPAPTVAPTVISPTQPTTAPTPEPMPEVVREDTQLSFTPATYRDDRAGIALDYPSAWTLDPSSQVGVRGGQALLLSPGTTAETLAEGGTRISLVTYLWDPKNDLDAWVAQRKIAWGASGSTITREEVWQLPDGRAAYIFILLIAEQPTFTLLTTVGDDYLQISGDGDLELVEEIARTLRISDS